MTPRTLFDECGIGDFVRLTHADGMVRTGILRGVRRGTKSMWVTIRGTAADWSLELPNIVRVECVRRRQETEVE